jgi:hypothetical protein
MTCYVYMRPVCAWVAWMPFFQAKCQPKQRHLPYSPPPFPTQTPVPNSDPPLLSVSSFFALTLQNTGAFHLKKKSLEVKSKEKKGKERVKGAVPRDFRIQVFSWQFPQAPKLGPYRCFSKIRADIRSSMLHHRCHWHRWLANISTNFWKESKWPYCYFQGLGVRWFTKKIKQISRDTVRLKYHENEGKQWKVWIIKKYSLYRQGFY